jgi:hypothetical protein
MELDTIYESDDSEDFLEFKDNILRTLYATICVTDYAAYFNVNIRINGYSIRALVNSGINGNFILSRIMNKFKLLIQRKKNPFHLKVINGIPISQNNGLVEFETKTLLIKI